VTKIFGDLLSSIFSQDALCGSVVVGNGCSIFVGATIMPFVRIGDRATVGDGAVVNKNVHAGATVASVPAKELHRRV
jgi:acetyltransferase-like isoleucine patch superfamily enzyme